MNTCNMKPTGVCMVFQLEDAHEHQEVVVCFIRVLQVLCLCTCTSRARS